MPATFAAPAESDIPFLEADRTEKLDAWLPPSRFPAPHPAVLLIHGGAWQSGDKAGEKIRQTAETLTASGYAVFSINYLLNKTEKSADGQLRITEVVWPRNLQDCEAALKWVRAEGAVRFAIDPDGIAVLGESAGAHLAVLLAANHPGDIRAVVSFYAPINVRRPHRSLSFAGSSPEETERFLAAASPLVQIPTDLPPVFLTHGDADQAVPVEDSRSLVGLLQKNDTPHEYVEIPGAPHGYGLVTGQTDLTPRVLAFLATHLKHSPQHAARD